MTLVGMRTELLTGWGRTAPTAAAVAEPATVDAVAALLQQAGPRGVIARGLGRAYGDPAQNAGGVVARLTRLARIHHYDPATGDVTVEAGVRLDTLLRMLLSRGRYLPVVPGTAHITVGGAIACDVHGKNHPVDGSFGDHLTGLTLHSPTGRLELTPQQQPEPFWATVGGLGLTGIITTATLKTQPIPTPHIRQRVLRCDDLDDLLTRMTTDTANSRFQAAWIDALGSGRDLGRSLLTQGEWASLTDVPDGHGPTDPHRLSYRHTEAGNGRAARPVLSRLATHRMLNQTTVRAFNTWRFHTAPRRPRSALVSPTAHFFPLDRIADWNRLYEPRGLVQYQFAVPDDSQGHKALEYALQAPQTAGCPAFLAVLKRFGARAHPYLSFPRPGWTLAMDFPAAADGLAALLDRLDERVLCAGGRLYLAKDSRARAGTIAAMYPDLSAWQHIRSRLDPNGILLSDQARRLQLLVPPTEG